MKRNYVTHKHIRVMIFANCYIPIGFFIMVMISRPIKSKRPNFENMNMRPPPPKGWRVPDNDVLSEKTLKDIDIECLEDYCLDNHLDNLEDESSFKSMEEQMNLLDQLSKDNQAAELKEEKTQAPNFIKKEVHKPVRIADSDLADLDDKTRERLRHLDLSSIDTIEAIGNQAAEHYKQVSRELSNRTLNRHDDVLSSLKYLTELSNHIAKREYTLASEMVFPTTIKDFIAVKESDLKDAKVALSDDMKFYRSMLENSHEIVGSLTEELAFAKLAQERYLKSISENDKAFLRVLEGRIEFLETLSGDAALQAHTIKGMVSNLANVLMNCNSAENTTIPFIRQLKHMTDDQEAIDAWRGEVVDLGSRNKTSIRGILMCAITVSSIGMLMGIYGVKSNDYHKNPEISTHQDTGSMMAWQQEMNYNVMKRLEEIKGSKPVPLENVSENTVPRETSVSKYDSQLDMIHEMMKKHPHDKGLKDLEKQIETIKDADEYTNMR